MRGAPGGAATKLTAANASVWSSPARRCEVIGSLIPSVAGITSSVSNCSEWTIQFEHLRFQLGIERRLGLLRPLCCSPRRSAPVFLFFISYIIDLILSIPKYIPLLPLSLPFDPSVKGDRRCVRAIRAVCIYKTHTPVILKLGQTAPTVLC